MFNSDNSELVTKTIKESDGITFELYYHLNLNDEELEELKEFSENFAKSSPIHFHFDEDKFQFSQKKYFKKKQFIKKPPEMDEIEKSFLNEIKIVLSRFMNFRKFGQLENIERSRQLDLVELLENK